MMSLKTKLILSIGGFVVVSFCVAMIYLGWLSRAIPMPSFGQKTLSSEVWRLEGGQKMSETSTTATTSGQAVATKDIIGGSATSAEGFSGQGVQSATSLPSIPTEFKVPENCNDDCLMNLAQEKQDASICGVIKQVNTQSQCFSGLAVAKRDKTVCQSAAGYQQDSCYYSLALETQDGTLCDLIGITVIKDMCFSDLALRQKACSLCDKIQDWLAHDFCLRELARTTQDSQCCLKVFEGAAKSQCYSDLAVAKKDSQLCSMAGNMQEQCLAKVQEAR